MNDQFSDHVSFLCNFGHFTSDHMSHIEAAELTWLRHTDSDFLPFVSGCSADSSSFWLFRSFIMNLHMKAHKHTSPRICTLKSESAAYVVRLLLSGGWTTSLKICLVLFPMMLIMNQADLWPHPIRGLNFSQSYSELIFAAVWLHHLWPLLLMRHKAHKLKPQTWTDLNPRGWSQIRTEMLQEQLKKKAGERNGAVL